MYKRYASLYFVCGVDTTDNELLVLEMIHHFVEVRPAGEAAVGSAGVGKASGGA